MFIILKIDHSVIINETQNENLIHRSSGRGPRILAITRDARDMVRALRRERQGARRLGARGIRRVSSARNAAPLASRRLARPPRLQPPATNLRLAFAHVVREPSPSRPHPQPHRQRQCPRDSLVTFIGVVLLHFGLRT